MKIKDVSGVKSQDDDAQEAARAAALSKVLRIKPEEMTAEELDLAAGLALGLPMAAKGSAIVFVGADGKPKKFKPSSRWEDYGRVVTSMELVVGTHAMYEDPADDAKVTGYWYSAHSFYGSTKTEGFDLRETVLQTVAKRLAHDTAYPKS